MTQRYSPSCLRIFIDDVIGGMMTSSPVYIKTRWTTSATSELYPILVEAPLLFGKDRPVTDKHRKIVMEQFLQQTLQSILLDGNINVSGLFVDYIDSWATPFATHYTNGLVETNLLSREETPKRVLKESGSYFSKIVKQNGFVPIDDGDGSGEGSGEESGDGAGDNDDDGGNLSVGVIVGITIGTLLGLVIIIIILRKFCCQSSKKTNNESANIYSTTNEAFDDPRDDLDGGLNDHTDGHHGADADNNRSDGSK